MSDFKQYTRKAYAELRPYIVGEDVTGISISDFDKKRGSPQAGDYIARNPQNHSDQWLVSAAYFAANHFEVVK
jgi:hypothetical protein